MKANLIPLWCCALLLVTVNLAGCGVSPKKSGAADARKEPGMGYRFKVERRGEWRMSPQSNVYIAWPEAHVGGNSSWPRTRTYLARQLADQARERFQTVTLAAVEDSSAALFELAVAADADFVMKLLVHHVDAPPDFPDVSAPRSNATDGTRISHKQLRMSLQVIEANSGRLLDTVNLSARRPWYLTELVQSSPLAHEAITLMLNQLTH